MKHFALILPAVLAGMFATGRICAQEPSAPKQANDIQLLQKQMLELQAGMKQMQAQHQQELDALKAKVQAQQKVIDDFQKTVASTAPPLPAKAQENPPVVSPPKTLEPLFPTTDSSVITGVPAPPPGGPSAMPPAFPTTDAAVTAVPGGSPLAAPLTLASGGGGKSYLNISFDGMFALAISTDAHLDRLEVGDHDPQQRGFNARNLELALDGAVDPYFEGFANIVFKLDNNDETSVEAEEAFMQTTSLPYGFQLKGGQFFAQMGRINSQHPHVWDFADSPLVNGRLLGPDGLRGVGMQVSWVAPVPWYSQFILGVQNGQGSTGYSFRNRGEDGVFYNRVTVDRPLDGVQDMAFIPRWENSIDLSPTQTLLVGVSGAFAPNETGTSTSTQIYGADVFYKWKPANAEGGWPYVKWQTEALYRRFEAGRGFDDSFPVSETFHDWGGYSQVVWGFHKGWNVGLRGDYLHMQDSHYTDDPDRQSRIRLSCELAWFPSEFSKLRLQYNHDHLLSNYFQPSSDANSVFLQFEFSLGAHGAHKF